jgi:hypothetical protein
MKKLYTTIILILISINIFAKYTTGPNLKKHPSLMQLLQEMEKAGQLEAVKMQYARPERFEALNKVYKKSVMSNMKWFRQHSKDKKFPFPYHENFGMSEDDYNYYISRDPKEKILFPIDTLSCNFTPTKIGYMLSIENDHPLFPIQFDLLRDNVDTEQGFLPFYGGITPSPRQSITGEWFGYIWFTRELPVDIEGLERKASVQIGKKLETGEYILIASYTETLNRKEEYKEYFYYLRKR